MNSTTTWTELVAVKDAIVEAIRAAAPKRLAGEGPNAHRRRVAAYYAAQQPRLNEITQRMSAYEGSDRPRLKRHNMSAALRRAAAELAREDMEHDAVLREIERNYGFDAADDYDRTGRMPA